MLVAVSAAYERGRAEGRIGSCVAFGGEGHFRWHFKRDDCERWEPLEPTERLSPASAEEKDQ